VFDDAVGCANRVTFVIDKSGKVADRFESENRATPRPRAEYDAALGKVS
jgi:peroxiredoxin